MHGINRVRPESLSPGGGLGGSGFWLFFPATSLGALTFMLYSPSWLILALHLLVRQVLTSVPVPLAVPSYFLLVAMIEVTSSKRLFSLTWSGRWQVHLMRRGRIFLSTNFAPCLHVGPIPLTSPSGGCLGIAFTKTLLFSSKSWSAEDRVVHSCSP